MVRDARLAWRFDQNLPHRLFELRGLDASRLPEFPFRDDTLLLWDAIRDFVGAYLARYYASDEDRAAWVDETDGELPPVDEPPFPRDLPRAPM